MWRFIESPQLQYDGKSICFCLEQGMVEKGIYQWNNESICGSFEGKPQDFRSHYILLAAVCWLLLIPVCAVAAFLLPDSGQSKCYETVSEYDVISCLGTGQDGEYAINPISYAGSGEGIVTDFNTGLMWQKEDDNTYRTRDGANSYCEALVLGIYDDWRLPGKKELTGIIDFSIPWTGPTINWSYFPGTESLPYWTSTDFAGDASIGWSVYFGHALVFEYSKNENLRVRCVRGDPVPSQGFTGDGDVATDSWTGLTWQRGEPGTRSWGGALAYCRGLTLANLSDWRLPNARELESLTDETRNNPAIDTGFFPNAAASSYWSSTTDDNWKGQAYVVNFAKGDISVADKSSELHVRCVRGEGGGTSGRVRIDGSIPDYFQTIQGAYDSLPPGGGTIQVWGTDFEEALYLSGDSAVILEGGYNSDYSNADGFTRVKGNMTIAGSGGVTVSNVAVY
jgi:hypothetical protein